MSKALIGLGSFFAGVGIGSVGVYLALNRKFEDDLNVELGNMKTYYEDKIEETINEIRVEENTRRFEEEKEIEKKLDETLNATAVKDYSAYSKPKKEEIPEPEPEPEDEKEEIKGPYVISPHEFGSKEGYEIITLYYYADEMLADDLNNPVDPFDVVGDDFDKHFGEYEMDSVYVRNEARRVDYEILKDLRTFDEALASGPRMI